jgi:hypothetical protein
MGHLSKIALRAMKLKGYMLRFNIVFFKPTTPLSLEIGQENVIVEKAILIMVLITASSVILPVIRVTI